jgi:histone-arginine methyltransferase CARM1
MDALVETISPDVLKTSAKECFAGLDVGALTQDNFLDLVSACGRRCIAKCPNSLPAIEVEGFVAEMAAQLWSDRQFSARCPLRELLSRLRVSSEFGPRECAFMTKYFYYFGKMRSHEGMMNDLGRSETYRQAILANPDDFKDKVVMDVGSGSGLLAFFAIQAGAKKVYAVEAGCMHEVIVTLAKANGWADRVVVVNKVLQDMTEDDCPLNSVDTIIAETLGTFLFGERGIETMLVARDRFLKEGGAIFPTQATLSIAPFSDQSLFAAQCARPAFWTTADFYGIDVSSCYERARVEQMAQVIASMVDPATLVDSQYDVVFDFRTLDSAALRNIKLSYQFTCARDADVHGLAGWFVAHFIGSNKMATQVNLSTSPFDTCTHWFQVRFLVPQPLVAKQGEVLKGTMNMMANEQQSYTCDFDMTLDSSRGFERQENSDMGLMDLDGSLKQYAYKIVRHGDINVACVDWEKTTAEFLQSRQPPRPSNGTSVSSGLLGTQVSLEGLLFVCVDAPEPLFELKLKNTTVIGKTGDDCFYRGAVGGDLTLGLIRQDGSGEQSFWMEKAAYTLYMIDKIVARKSHLEVSFQTKPDDEVILHLKKLSFYQVTEVYDALKAL